MSGRSPVAVLAALAALAALAGACSVSFAVELEDELGRGLFTARVEFPLGSGFRKGRYFPVEIELRGPVRPRRGSLVVEDGEASFIPPQGGELASGRRYSCLLLLSESRYDPAVVVRAPPPRGEELFRAGLADALFPLAGRERLVLAVGEGIRLPSGSVGTVFLRRQAVRPENLPRDASHLECADIIALDESGLDGLSRAQLAALRSWVLGGGRLIACSPRAAQTLARLLLADELGPKSDAVIRRVKVGKALAAVVFECGLGSCLAYLQPPEATRTRELDELLAEFVTPIDMRSWERVAAAARALGAPEVRRGRWAWLASLAAVSFLLLPLFLRRRAVLIAAACGSAAFWSCLAYVMLPPGAARGAKFSFARASVDGRALVSREFLLARVRGDLQASSSAPLKPLRTSGEMRTELFQGETWRVSAEGEGELLLAARDVRGRERGEEVRNSGLKSRAGEFARKLPWRIQAGEGPLGGLEKALLAPGMPFAWLRGRGRIECGGEFNELGLLLRVEAESR